MKTKLIFPGIILLLFATVSIAAKDFFNAQNGQVIQSIQVVNLLGNTDLSDPGMTSTPIVVKYYNGNPTPCWVSVLNFQDDTTIHAGPMMGCVNKVSEVVIEPSIVANKLKTYYPSINVPIDVSKYANQITVIQDQAPSFDTQSGLVVKPGTITVKVQSMQLA